MQAVFLDATQTLAAIMARLLPSSACTVTINQQPDITPAEIPGALGRASVALIDHTALPTEVAQRCPALRHVIFLGTGARSYMDPEALAQLGIEVHTISGYGDTAVAEMTVALLWAAARSLARMDRHLRGGLWTRTDGIQLTGKTLGLIGFGGIAREVVRWSPSCASSPGTEPRRRIPASSSSRSTPCYRKATPSRSTCCSRLRPEAFSPGKNYTG